MKPIKAFHFSGPHLAYDLNSVQVEPGLRVELDTTVSLELCNWGLHGSEHIVDALGYAKGLTLSRTEHSGEVLWGDGKLCSRIRTHTSVIDATKPVVAWAQWCARRAEKCAAAAADAYAAYAAARAKAAAARAETAADAYAAAEAAAYAAAADAYAAYAAARAKAAAAATTAARAERNLQEKVLLAYVKHAGLQL